MSDLYLFEEITLDTAQRVLIALATGPIDTIWVNSPGGSVEAALAIYEALVPRHVATIATGQCASAAMLILLAGDKRYATPLTRFAVHAPLPSADSLTCAADLAEVSHLQGLMAELYAERTGTSMVRIHRLLSGVSYFGVEQAIKDRFITSTWPLPQEAA